MDHDIIGDVHGHAQELRELLKHLGYRETDRAWRHPTRQALFVGDFIDRGPGQLETIDLVRRMVDTGSAQAVMGNHEFNAIAWHTPDPLSPGEYLRPRGGVVGHKNLKQHDRFLAEVSDSNVHDDIVNWSLTLPLWLDLPSLRLVHACWHDEYMRELAPMLTPNYQLTRELVVRASRPGLMEFCTVEGVTKGIEVPLPEGHAFLDKDGNERRSVRIRWWDNEAFTYRALALMPPEDLERIPEIPVPAWARCGHGHSKPVFFGHYWMSGSPTPVSENAVCVDYSVARGGKLVAYRFDAGEPLSADRFDWAGA